MICNFRSQRQITLVRTQYMVSKYFVCFLYLFRGLRLGARSHLYVLNYELNYYVYLCSGINI